MCPTPIRGGRFQSKAAFYCVGFGAPRISASNPRAERGRPRLRFSAPLRVTKTSSSTKTAMPSSWLRGRRRARSRACRRPAPGRGRCPGAGRGSRWPARRSQSARRARARRERCAGGRRRAPGACWPGSGIASSSQAAQTTASGRRGSGVGLMVRSCSFFRCSSGQVAAWPRQAPRGTPYYRVRSLGRKLHVRLRIRPGRSRPPPRRSHQTLQESLDVLMHRAKWRV